MGHSRVNGVGLRMKRLAGCNAEAILHYSAKNTGAGWICCPMNESELDFTLSGYRYSECGKCGNSLELAFSHFMSKSQRAISPRIQATDA